jgi:hypothetical protein
MADMPNIAVSLGTFTLAVVLIFYAAIRWQAEDLGDAPFDGFDATIGVIGFFTLAVMASQECLL